MNYITLFALILNCLTVFCQTYKAPLSQLSYPKQNPNENFCKLRIHKIEVVAAPKNKAQVGAYFQMDLKISYKNGRETRRDTVFQSDINGPLQLKLGERKTIFQPALAVSDRPGSLSADYKEINIGMNNSITLDAKVEEIIPPSSSFGLPRRTIPYISNNLHFDLAVMYMHIISEQTFSFKSSENVVTVIVHTEIVNNNSAIIKNMEKYFKEFNLLNRHNPKRVDLFDKYINAKKAYNNEIANLKQIIEFGKHKFNGMPKDDIIIIDNKVQTIKYTENETIKKIRPQNYCAILKPFQINGENKIGRLIADDGSIIKYKLKLDFILSTLSLKDIEFLEKTYETTINLQMLNSKFDVNHQMVSLGTKGGKLFKVSNSLVQVIFELDNMRYGEQISNLVMMDNKMKVNVGGEDIDFNVIIEEQLRDEVLNTNFNIDKYFDNVVSSEDYHGKILVESYIGNTINSNESILTLDFIEIFVSYQNSSQEERKIGPIILSSKDNVKYNRELVNLYCKDESTKIKIEGKAFYDNQKYWEEIKPIERFGCGGNAFQIHLKD